MKSGDVALDIDTMASLLDGIERKVLDAGHHVGLNALDRTERHGADVHRVLAIRLLRPTPARVSNQVHADSCIEVRTPRTRLAAYCGCDR